MSFKIAFNGLEWLLKILQLNVLLNHPLTFWLLKNKLVELVKKKQLNSKKNNNKTQFFAKQALEKKLCMRNRGTGKTIKITCKIPYINIHHI